MNYEKLKGNEGAIVRIMPPACHLNADGEVEDWPNETWTILSVDKSNVTIRTEAGHEFTLNSDHVRGYTSGSKPYLTLLLQIFNSGRRNLRASRPVSRCCGLAAHRSRAKGESLFCP
jgi:hypothetical protein